MHTELEERLRFETLLAEISARFVNLLPDRIDGEIEGAQRRICEILSIDRSALWQVPERKPGVLLLTHIHQPQGGPPVPERPNGRDLFPWTSRKVLAGESVTITKVSDLPREADRDRESFDRYGTKSTVLVPLSVGGGPPFGVLTFAVMREEMDWPETVVKGLQLIAHVFANALARKLADEALRDSEARLSLVTNAAGVGLWIMELESGHLWVTPKTRELFQFAPDAELNYESFIKVIHPEDRERFRQAVQQALRSGENLLSDYRIVQPDGSIRWIVARGQRYVQSTGEPVRMMGVSLDITERKLVERALEERLRFEQLLSGLSARFANIPPDRVDSEIERGLREILELFQVDRCALLRSLPGKTSWRITHVAHSDDVPPEANVDKQTLTEWGIRSNVNIPILIGGSVDYIISINSVKSERVWPKEFFPQLGLLGEVFVNTLERRQIRLETEERLRFETLVSDISAGFVNLPLGKVDSEIKKGLRSITEFFDADRCSIGLFSGDGNQLALAFEYHSAWVEPALESMSKEQMPWYMEQLIQGKPVVVNQVEDLPPEAENERRLCRVKGMKSFLSVPLVSGGMTLGSCALVSTRAEQVWPQDLVQRFRLISEVYANALQRKRAEEASRESERILKQNESDLRGLSGRLIYAQEEERSRLARELHDDLAQRLAVFAIDVGELEKQLMDPPAPVRDQLREMKKNIVKISQDVHSISRQLHPSILDDLGLIKAVESECAGFSRREGIEIVFNHENIPTIIPKDISLSLYRIIQEGLTNISKHACAEHISVSLKGIDHDVLLSVQDDGIGFDSAEVKKQPGLGFSSMRERARLIHGELSVKSQPEKGTVITLRVPLTGE